MTKRYFGNEDDDDQFHFENEFDDGYEEFEEGEEEHVAYIDSEGLVNMMHMDLAQSELNQHILGKAIELAQQSFFWRFKSMPSKLKEIKKVYRQLIRMTEEEEEEEEGEE
jgi:hypothetical protein